MWITEVASAWLMLSITSSPLWVSLIQTASMAPILIFGLLTGALADRSDKKVLMVFSQVWIAVISGLIFMIVVFGGLNKYLLLILMFANGFGLAVRWPVFASIMPELVSKPDLSSALALNGVSINLSRVIGPIFAGLVVVYFGVKYNFLLIFVLSISAAIILILWKFNFKKSVAIKESFGASIINGIRLATSNQSFRVIIVNLSIFFVNAISVFCLLPLASKGISDGPTYYTLLLACSGLGALIAAFFYPYLARRFPSRNLIYIGFMVQGLAAVILGLSQTVLGGMIAMFVSGVSYLTTSNTLIVSAQVLLTDPLRARGMSMVQMTIMGGGALGSVLWGKLAEFFSVQFSLVFSGISIFLFGIVLLLFYFRKTVKL